MGNNVATIIKTDILVHRFGNERFVNELFKEFVVEVNYCFELAVNRGFQFAQFSGKKLPIC